MKTLDSKLFEKSQVNKNELKSTVGGYEHVTGGTDGDGNKVHDFVRESGVTSIIPAEPIVAPVNP